MNVIVLPSSIAAGAVSSLNSAPSAASASTADSTICSLSSTDDVFLSLPSSKAALLLPMALKISRGLISSFNIPVATINLNPLSAAAAAACSPSKREMTLLKIFPKMLGELSVAAGGSVASMPANPPNAPSPRGVSWRDVTDVVGRGRTFPEMYRGLKMLSPS